MTETWRNNNPALGTELGNPFSSWQCHCNAFCYNALGKLYKSIFISTGLIVGNLSNFLCFAQVSYRFAWQPVTTFWLDLHWGFWAFAQTFNSWDCGVLSNNISEVPEQLLINTILPSPHPLSKIITHLNIEWCLDRLCSVTQIQNKRVNNKN